MNSEDSNTFGWIHSTLPGAAVDGPGLRYLIFMSGCAFRCLYCHNPDTWKLKAGTKTSLATILSGIHSYLPFLKAGGGLTVSGGEPLTQEAFVHRLFLRVKEEWNLHTALDTQAYLAPKLPDSWFDPVDLLLLDLKHIQDDAHKELTAFSNKTILESAQRFSRMGKKMWIRHVVVPGYTDNPSDARALARFVRELDGVERVEILPFHQMGAHKWRELGLEYRLKDTPPASEELCNRIKDEFRAENLPVM